MILVALETFVLIMLLVIGYVALTATGLIGGP